MISQERLKEFVKYDPETGLFTWLVDISDKNKAGDVAGKLDAFGYIVITIEQVRYKAHRLAFLYMTGTVPKLVDHKDTIKDNNSWINLRPGDKSKNAANKNTHSNNKCGFKGVSIKRNRFRAQIFCNGKSRTIGSFDTPEEAHEAYKKEALIVFGEFARY